MEQSIKDYLVEEIERNRRYRQDAIDDIAGFNISIKGLNESVIKYNYIIEVLQNLLDKNKKEN
jgi:hypothetical protein